MSYEFSKEKKVFLKNREIMCKMYNLQSSKFHLFYCR